MDKSYINGTDHFVSPYLRRRLRPLAEVLHEEQPELRAGLIEGGGPPSGGLDGLAAVANGPSKTVRNGQNCAD